MRRPCRADSDDGYVVVMAALLLVPMLLFVGFAIDLGAWYSRGAELQRVADLSALAGVVYMPDFDQAKDVAEEAAERNGFTTGGDITVSVVPVIDNPYRLRVVITDAAADQWFSKLVKDRQSITRESTAEYFASLPMGSPNNYFGTGPVFTGSPPTEGVWASVNGYCASRENGDPLLAAFDNTFSGTAYECDTASGAIDNPDYDPQGYVFSIETGPSPPPSVDVEVWDAGYLSGSTPSSDSQMMGGQSVTTTFRVLDTGSAADPYSHPVISSVTIAPSDTSWQGWRSVGTINSPCANCTYYLQVYTANEPNSAAVNAFGIRTTVGGVFTPCSSEVGSVAPGYDANCVRVYPTEHMSILAALSGASPTFYLTEISSQYAGKIVEIDMFDLGEGAALVEILDPNGNPITFDWSTPCNPPDNMSGPCKGNGATSLDPLPTGNQPYPRLLGQSVFNDRTLTLRFQLPINYGALYGTKTWWRVRYTTATAPRDRTTWSIRVVGSPVHLTADD